MAQRAGLNPLTALGLPDDLTFTPDVALLLHELLSPPTEGKSESELDEAAAQIMARMDWKDSRDQALRTGYRGPRGTVQPVVPRTVQVPWPERIQVALHPDSWAKLQA